MDNNIANRDEARKCLAIARRCIHEGQLEKAEKFALKAERLYASMEVQTVLEAIESARAAASSSRQSEQQAGGRRSQEQARENGHAGHQAGAGPNLPPRKPAEGLRHRNAAPAAPAPPKEDPGTPEQRALVAQILKAKDFYQMLDLPRTATEDDIKKAYKKLALRVHPDKCPATGADDAFKAVGRAVKVLTDADKRAYYDRTGFESSAAATAAQASQRGGAAGPGPGFYYTAGGDDFDPEEIFNMFFGGGFGGTPHARVFRAQFGGAPRQRHHHSHHQNHHEQQQRAAVLSLLQVLPVVLILVFTFFQSSQSPPYSLVREASYGVEVLTQRLAVPYYVKSTAELERTYPAGSGGRTRLERQVESAYYERLEARCQQERLMRHRAWSWGNREQARAMKLEACEEIDRVNEKLGMRRQQSAF